MLACFPFLQSPIVLDGLALSALAHADLCPMSGDRLHYKRVFSDFL